MAAGARKGKQPRWGDLRVRGMETKPGWDKDESERKRQQGNLGNSKGKNFSEGERSLPQSTEASGITNKLDFFFWCHVWGHSPLPFPADSPLLLATSGGNWNKSTLALLHWSHSPINVQSTGPLDTQGAGVCGQASAPCRRSPVPLFLSWALLILACGWVSAWEQLPVCLAKLLQQRGKVKLCKENLIGGAQGEEDGSALWLRGVPAQERGAAHGGGSSGWPTKNQKSGLQLWSLRSPQPGFGKYF